MDEVETLKIIINTYKKHNIAVQTLLDERIHKIKELEEEVNGLKMKILELQNQIGK